MLGKEALACGLAGSVELAHHDLHHVVQVRSLLQDVVLVEEFTLLLLPVVGQGRLLRNRVK